MQQILDVVAIHRADGTFLWATASGPLLEAAPGEPQSLECTLELPLLEGRYLLSGTVQDSASSGAAYPWGNAYKFEVMGDHESLSMEGLVRIPCRWELPQPSTGGSWLGRAEKALARK